MKVKSLQTRFIILICIGIVLTEALTSAVGTYAFKEVLENDSDRIIELAAGEASQELNALFGRIEQSVDVMAEHALTRMESAECMIHDAEYLEKYTADIEKLGNTVADKTAGAIGVYIRYNPDIFPADSGFFSIRPIGEKEFYDIPVTDFSKYDKDDAEHVGWYYGPIANGKPTWMLPYYNGNIDVYMISYVVPLYKDGETIGIIGMDIDFEYIKEQVYALRVYDTGHAFLTDMQYRIIHGEQIFSEDFKITYKPLENNMCLGIAVRKAEIMQEMNRMIRNIMMLSLVAILLCVVVTIYVARSITKPLKQLESVAREIADGNLDVEITCNTKDEVGRLAQSFRDTTKQLKTRIEYINNLAYVDELTGLKNNTAYWQNVSRLQESNAEGYAVCVIDLNGLKQINDVFGHHCGNEMIITISKHITDIFGYENAYRAGGDEFLVLLTGKKAEEIETLKNTFISRLEKQTGNIRAKAAVGYAIHEPGVTYEEVFRLADSKMYEHKEEMKQKGENSTVFTGK